MCFSNKKISRKELSSTSTNYVGNKDGWVNTIFCMLTVAMVLIVAAGIWMFIEARNFEANYTKYEDRWLIQRNAIYSTAIPADSVLTKVIPVRDKHSGKNKTSELEINEYLVPVSEISKIKETQKLLLMRQDQLTDDIRQETNNIINKMNGWLGFWMAVMAILGVFVPIALQIKLYRENRDSDARLRQACREELDQLREYENKCETGLRNEQAKITQELLNMEIKADKQFQELKQDFENEYHKDREALQRIKFAALIRSFHNIIDSPEIQATDVRNELLRKNWEEIFNLVRDFIEHFTTTQSQGNGEYYVMSVVIVQVVSAITSLRIIGSRRNRLLETLSSESYRIIEALNSTTPDRERIIRSLLNYQESLSQVSPLIL